MKTKDVYVNDALIGEAATWAAVYLLLTEKGIGFIGAPNAIEGPTAFFLRGDVEKLGHPKLGSVAAPGAHTGASERARAIARGLINTERAGPNVEPDNGMLRLECLHCGYYWIAFDGSRAVRGETILEADELQSKFTKAMERAGILPGSSPREE